MPSWATESETSTIYPRLAKILKIGPRKLKPGRYRVFPEADSGERVSTRQCSYTDRSVGGKIASPTQELNPNGLEATGEDRMDSSCGKPSA